MPQFDVQIDLTDKDLAQLRKAYQDNERTKYMDNAQLVQYAAQDYFEFCLENEAPDTLRTLNEEGGDAPTA